MSSGSQRQGVRRTDSAKSMRLNLTKSSLVPILAFMLLQADQRVILTRAPSRLDTIRITPDRWCARELRALDWKLVGCRGSPDVSKLPTMNSILERSMQAQARLQGTSPEAQTDSPKPDNREVISIPTLALLKMLKQNRTRLAVSTPQYPSEEFLMACLSHMQEKDSPLSSPSSPSAMALSLAQGLTPTHPFAYWGPMGACPNVTRLSRMTSWSQVQVAGDTDSAKSTSSSVSASN